MENNDLNLTLLRLFHQCSHRMRNAGKYRGQGRLLVLLMQNGTLTQRALGDMTCRRSATLSEQLDSMAQAGYITREKNREDHRNVDVTLTPPGLAAAEDALAARAELADRLFSAVSAEEKQQLLPLLQKLADAWEPLAAENKE